jgi:hypothetical protein
MDRANGLGRKRVKGELSVDNWRCVGLGQPVEAARVGGHGKLVETPVPCVGQPAAQAVTPWDWMTKGSGSNTKSSSL